MKFCEKLIILRKRRGFTQEEFAKAVGVSRQSVYKWESGRSYPEAEKLMEIRRLYGISVDELLDESETLPLTEEKKSARPSLEVPPAPAPIYEEKPAPREMVYAPVSASPGEESSFWKEEKVSDKFPSPKPEGASTAREKEKPAGTAQEHPVRPRISVSEPSKNQRKKKQNPLLELVGSIFGRKR